MLHEFESELSHVERQNDGGGELRIHNQQGQIRDSDTPPGNDPNPPRDKR